MISLAYGNLEIAMLECELPNGKVCRVMDRTGGREVVDGLCSWKGHGKDGWEEGRTIGRKEGRKEGWWKGRKDGCKEGL